jgi:hypothetical protein
MVIVAQVAIDDAGELPGRTSVRQMAGWPVDVVGFNCCVPLEEIAPRWAIPLSAMPNAGMPTRPRGHAGCSFG